MSNQISTARLYNVRFEVVEPDIDWKVTFAATDPESIKRIIEACSSHNSGDECKCWIDGQEVLLERDWGLLFEEGAE